jgi:hypothetical protein
MAARTCRAPDHLPYNQQAVIVNRIIEHFGVWKFYYDSTRAELDD